MSKRKKDEDEGWGWMWEVAILATVVCIILYAGILFLEAMSRMGGLSH